MAIDSSLYAAVIPAATYAVGDKIPLGVIRGPAIVRDGYGRAVLKRIFTGSTTGNAFFTIKVKNSNWVDSMSNMAHTASDTSVLANESGAIQNGQDVDLVANSGWEVVAECFVAGTESAAADVFCLIDVDYPSVAAVQNPKAAKGFPVTIDGQYSHTITGKGTLATGAVWDTFNVDILKAGSRYLLTEAGIRDPTNGFGFISISGAAGQAGLERIVPSRTAAAGGMRYSLDYSTPLVKGPMNLNILSIGTAGTTTAYVYLDFVKKAM